MKRYLVDTVELYEEGDPNIRRMSTDDVVVLASEADILRKHADALYRALCIADLYVESGHLGEQADMDVIDEALAAYRAYINGSDDNLRQKEDE